MLGYAAMIATADPNGCVRFATVRVSNDARDFTRDRCSCKTTVTATLKGTAKYWSWRNMARRAVVSEVSMYEFVTTTSGPAVIQTFCVTDLQVLGSTE